MLCKKRDLDIMMGETESISLFKSGAEAFCFSICAGAPEGLKTWWKLCFKSIKLGEIK